jgi:CDP-diacylglycerol--glycerol-3-phosphate 3-phosphatidyltransferase
MAGLVLMWAVIFFALLSAVSYFRKFWHKVDARIKKRRRRELLALEQKRQRELLRQRGSLGGVPSDLGATGGATIWKPPEVN